MSRPPAQQSAAPGLPARKAALAMLSETLRKKRPLDAVAADILNASALAPRDAGFARAIATTALRRFGQLEALIRHFVPKSPPPHKAGPTLEILIAGAAELLFLDVAPHATVDAANRLAESDSKAVHFKSLINAVLRRVAREGAGIVASQDAGLNVPDWLWQRWQAHYGEADARAIAAAHTRIPPLDLTLKSPDDPCTDLSGNRLAPGRMRLEHAGRIEELPGFGDGRWWVQDFAASLPARLLGDVTGKAVLDLCAAPGGKTLQLAAAGADVTAIDLSRERLALIEENLKRVHLDAKLVVADARDWRPATPAPFVLLDAPCTATGTIRRHPDLPWLKEAADLQICESLQGELLEAAAEMTVPGGLLVYAVCSLEPEEGEERIAAFLHKRTDFAREKVKEEEVFDSQLLTEAGDLKALPSFWPDKGGMDGFFAARLRRSI
ncbi:MAG: methyltransferase domain-containing protein [Alphaproteobacteria bacterium]|nr:methyltransferase domain-containing protein [Alphaproteobacteria bacterium]